MHPSAPLFPLAAIIIIAVANRKRRNIIDAFRKSSATSIERAKTLVDLGISNSFLFTNEVRQRVIVPSQGDAYYLDEGRLEKVMLLRRRIALGLGVSLLILALILFLIS